MSRCIAIANQKGGVGKTTTCVNLTAALASIGKRVLLIDLDPQGNATMGCGIDKYDLDRSVFEVLVDGMSVAEARVRSDSNNCDVLPATADLTAAEIELMAMDQRERRLATALEAVSAEYDYMLIDCPPSLSILTLNAFVAANGILVPVQCEYYALEGLSALLDTIESVRETVNPTLAIDGLLRTMHDARNNLGTEVSAQLIEHFGDQVLKAIVPRNIRLAEAPSHGLSIIHYDRSSRGARAYFDLAREIDAVHGTGEAVHPQKAVASASSSAPTGPATDNVESLVPRLVVKDDSSEGVIAQKADMNANIDYDRDEDMDDFDEAALGLDNAAVNGNGVGNSSGSVIPNMSALLKRNNLPHRQNLHRPIIPLQQKML